MFSRYGTYPNRSKCFDDIGLIQYIQMFWPYVTYPIDPNVLTIWDLSESIPKQIFWRYGTYPIYTNVLTIWDLCYRSKCFDDMGLIQSIQLFWRYGTYPIDPNVFTIWDLSNIFKMFWSIWNLVPYRSKCFDRYGTLGLIQSIQHVLIDMGLSPISIKTCWIDWHKSHIVKTFE